MYVYRCAYVCIMYVYVCIYIYVCMCVYVCRDVYVCVCVHAYIEDEKARALRRRQQLFCIYPNWLLPSIFVSHQNNTQCSVLQCVAVCCSVLLIVCYRWQQPIGVCIYMRIYICIYMRIYIHMTKYIALCICRGRCEDGNNTYSMATTANWCICEYKYT